MRYTQDGSPVFHRLSKTSPFSEVCVTAIALGYSIDVESEDWVRLNHWTYNDRGEKDKYESRHVKTAHIADFLNLEMEERGYIKREEVLE